VWRIQPVFPLDWAAGVFDGCAVLRLRTKDDDEVIGAEVQILCLDEEMLKELMHVLGGARRDRHEGTVWYMPADGQAATLKKLVPRMHNARRRRQAERIIMYRATQTKEPASPAVKKLREKLARGERY
jgi:hypothetical protein